MADFTGMVVQVTLQDGRMLQGMVGNIVPSQSITLEKVLGPGTASLLPRYTVRSSDIAHIQIAKTSTPPVPRLPPLLPQPNSTPALAPFIPPPQHVNTAPGSVLPMRPAEDHTQRQPSGFVDPAIMSYGRSPAPKRPETQLAEPAAPVTPVKAMLAKAAESLPPTGSPFIAEAGNTSSARKTQHPKETKNATAGGEQLGNTELDAAQEAGQLSARQKKKPRSKAVKRKGEPGTVAGPPPVMNIEVSRNGNDMNGGVRRGKGWRQTPLLQPSPQTLNVPSSGGKKKTRRDVGAERESNQNGWATEDATDIQEMGEYDFEASHKLFDKKTVFDQLRQGDTTADEERLVSHNKIHRPGTHGGKNLHPTENVLSPQLGPKHSGNDALDSTSDADTELNFTAINGARSSSRHSTTRTAAKRGPSRQNSAQMDARPHPLSASITSDRAMSRSRASLAGKPGRSVASITTSPMPDRAQSPRSALSTKTPMTSSVLLQAREAHLAIYPTSNTCPVLHPAAVETLEKETVARYGLSYDAITESAARSIAETAMSVFQSTTDSRRGSRANTLRGNMLNLPAVDRTSPPVVVVLAGNHAVGARAVAAARHLVSRQTMIILAEAQYEGASTQDSHMKTQLAMLKRMVKGGANIKRGPWSKASNYIKNLPSPPAVIIDALLAGSTYDSLSEDSSSSRFAIEASQEAREMIEWANRSRAPVLSISCPSGVSGLDGTSTTIDGEPLAVRPDKVLCLAVPMQGVLDAMKAGERWDVSLADIGINIVLRSDEAVAFGSQWVVELRYIDGDGESGQVEASWTSDNTKSGR